MNRAAEHRTAEEVLEQHAAAPIEGVDRRLAGIINAPEWTDVIKVQQFDKPKTWRLVCGGDGEEAKEEVVFLVQGSVVEKDLPPILSKPRMPVEKYKYLRQYIKISGLGTPTFEAALQSTGEIYGQFDRNFPDGALEGWSAANSQGTGGDVLEASNRYMVQRRDASGSDIPFGELVDPKKILEGMARDSQQVHTDDNEVLYFKRRTGDDGKHVYEKVGPQMFRVGDIVELQVTFVVVPLKGDRYKMMSVLRSIALIDGSFSQPATTKRSVDSQGPTLLKRKVMYEQTSDASNEGRASKRGAMDVDVESRKTARGHLETK
ncbi:hypothetical protein LshimejAT787_0702170 [Lyophyllum shimeji]|uniref:Uncharacterized protein n=1 Tax=Lyophyllum shimeji TaxID=47721 RepID=A0A9P3PQU4_LYOSH|nr:hypothetical protein LshimejAT787_0702170 [Lyophyllum shimeji]